MSKRHCKKGTNKQGIYFFKEYIYIMSDFPPHLFLSIGTKLYLDSLDKKHIEDILEETSCKLEEYTIKLQEYQKHLDYIKSENPIFKNDIITLQNNIDTTNNLYQEYLIYYEIIYDYIEESTK